MKLDPAWLLEGLTEAQIKGVIKVGWRLAIVVHIGWVCGWFQPIGLDPPFARAGDVTTLERKTDVLLRAAIDTSLRGLMKARCQVTGERERQVIDNEINVQKAEWHSLTKREWQEPREPCKVEQ